MKFEWGKLARVSAVFVLLPLAVGALQARENLDGSYDSIHSVAPRRLSPDICTVDGASGRPVYVGHSAGAQIADLFGAAERGLEAEGFFSSDLDAETPPKEPSYDWSELESTLQAFVPGTLDGLTFLLLNGWEVLYAGAFGNQTLDSFLPIASSTKMPSAAAILTLVDEGKLDLDRPVGEYLSGRIDWPQDKASITMRMLLNHTSGLRGDPPCLADQEGTTLQECAQAIAYEPLDFEPGTKFAYGGGSFQMAGYVAEMLAGKPWTDFFEERLGAPLGLARFTCTDTQNPRIAGGAFSNAQDYGRILQMFLNGGSSGGRQILSSATIAVMKTNQIEGLPVVRSPGGEDLPGYSFGWWISDPSLHPGSEGPELSDQGAFGCTPWIDFGPGYGAVLLIKDRTSTGTAIWNAVRPVILEQLLAVAPLTTAFSFTPESPTDATPVTFTASAAGGTPPYAYDWDVCGQSASGEEVTAALAPGSCAVTLTVTDAAGAAATATQGVEVGHSIAVTGVAWATDPARLKVFGSGFGPGCKVRVGGSAVPKTVFKEAGKIVAKGGSVLKSMVPKGAAVEITVVSADGRSSSPLAFMR